MKRAARAVDIASISSGWVAIVFMWLLAMVTFTDILSRLFLHRSLPGNLEIATILLEGIVFMGVAWTLRAGGHVQIGLLSSRLSQRSHRWLMLFLAIVAIGTVGFIAFHAWRGLVELYVMNIVGESELYIPKWWSWTPFLVGLVLLVMQFGAGIVENIISPRATREPGKSLSPVWLIGLWVILIGIISLILVSPQAPKMALWLVLLVMFALIFGFIFGGLWIFVSMSAIGMLGIIMFTSYPVGAITAKVFYNANYSFVLTCLPLFILMGELLLRSGASEHLYAGLSSWVSKIPGGLFHSNVLSCTIFAAISGSSAATCATIANVAVPELKKRGYSIGMSLGSLAGAGTLGLLIPPSIVMIVYGAIATESIGQLYLGGVIPGLILSSLFMCYILAMTKYRPSIAPMGGSYSWGERIRGLVEILPIVFLIGLVLGLIYLGITTPTEAGAVGAIGAFCTLLLYRRLSWRVIKEASWSALRTTCMITIIIAGATLLSVSTGYLRVPQYLVEAIAAAGLSKYLVLAVVCMVYIALGCLLEGISIMLLTLPIVYPLVISMGFNGIWFGIIVVILIETAQVTPPVGFNLYVLQNISGESIGMVARNTFPFFLLMCATIILLTFFPDLVLLLPNMMIVNR